LKRLLIGTAIFTSVFASSVLAESVMVLDIQESCTTRGPGIDFECQDEDLQLTMILKEGEVLGVNPSGGTYALKVQKVTKQILIVDNPVFFEGTSTIYITVPDSSFYWVEGAYNMFDQREFTIRSGTVRSK